ncbi:MAG: hypothetical protein JW795_08665 [Chitinivibrionales bacterium]|nr:hypothetical protein [Chitinivibrionales bacterium]
MQKDKQVSTNQSFCFVDAFRDKALTILKALYPDSLREAIALYSGEFLTGDHDQDWIRKGRELLRNYSVYKDTFGRGPLIKAIYAGLECGLIGDKFSGMDMIAIGCTIKNTHSPQECVEIASIGAVFAFLATLLKSNR